jgi:multicomponent Na+:H+ antiporter subunit C
MSILPYLVAGWVLLVGLWGAVTSRHLVHLIVCVSLVQSSTYVLLLAVGYHAGRAAPVFLTIPNSTPAVDPVVQALSLTDIVVSATMLALMLALAVQAHKRFGTLDPDELRTLEG